MKKTCALLSLLLLVCCIGYAQAPSSVTLEYVGNDFPIKIDGGGNFYTYDTVSLNHHQYILVINDASNWITSKSNKRTAFLKVSDKPDYVFLHAPGHTHAKGMDTATFKGEGYVIILNTRKVKKIDSGNDLYKGSLTLKHNKKMAVIQIQGEVHHDY